MAGLAGLVGADSERSGRGTFRSGTPWIARLGGDLQSMGMAIEPVQVNDPLLESQRWCDGGRSKCALVTSDLPGDLLRHSSKAQGPENRLKRAVSPAFAVSRSQESRSSSASSIETSVLILLFEIQQ